MDANVSNATASTSKNTQDNSMNIKNSARSRVITASITCFIVKDSRPHSVAESDGSGDMVR